MAVLVTGGSQGIGLAIAKRLAEPGTLVFLNYHSNHEAAGHAETEIAALGAVPVLVWADVGTLAGIRDLAAQITARTDHLDVVVHAAAMAITGRLVDIPGEQLDAAIATNGTSIVHLVRETQLLLRAGSSVIYVTSAGSTRALKGYGALGGPKALAEQLTRYLATELAGQGIRVNCISPGPLDTEARRRMFPDTWESRLHDQVSANPSGRGVEFDDVANIVELMCSPLFSMVQGQVLTIDGGLTL